MPMKEIVDTELKKINGHLFTQLNKHGRSVKPSFRAEEIRITTDDDDVYVFRIHSWDEYPHFVNRRFDGNHISHTASRLPKRVKEYLENEWGGYVYRSGLPYVDAQFIDNGVYFCTMYKEPEYLFEA